MSTGGPGQGEKIVVSNAFLILDLKTDNGEAFYFVWYKFT